MAMSESSWSISEKAVLELIELVLDGQMTVETFTELAEHLDDSTWEEAVVEIIEYRSSLSAKTIDETAFLTGSNNSSKKKINLDITTEEKRKWL